MSAPMEEVRDTPSPELGLFPSHYPDFEEERSKADAEPKKDDDGSKLSRKAKTKARRSVNEIPISELNVTHRRPKTRKMSRFSPASVIQKHSPRHTRPSTVKHSLQASTALTAFSAATTSSILKFPTLDEHSSFFTQIQSEFALPTIPVIKTCETAQCLEGATEKTDLKPLCRKRQFAGRRKETTADAILQNIFSLRFPTSDFELPRTLQLQTEPLVSGIASSAHISTTSATAGCSKVSTTCERFASTSNDADRPRREKRRRKEYSPELSPRKTTSPQNPPAESAQPAEVVSDVAAPTEALVDSAENQDDNEPMGQEPVDGQPQAELCNSDHAVEVLLPSVSSSAETRDDGPENSQGISMNIVENTDAEQILAAQPASSNGAADAAKPRFQIHPAMFLRENASPQKHNLFDERKALFSKEDEQRLNESVRSLPPDSDSDSDTDSQVDLDLTIKLEKYQDPEFIRQNPELEGAALLLSDPKLLAEVKKNRKTIRDHYRGRRGMFTSGEPVYLLSEASDAVNDLAPLERLALSHPHSEIHHQARDHLLNVLYQLDDKREGAAYRKGPQDGVEKKSGEADLEAVIAKPKSSFLSFATIVPVLRFLCQTDIFPRNISDVIAQSCSGSRRKSLPESGQLTPRNTGPSNGSRTVQLTQFDRVHVALRETSDPVEEELRPEHLLPTLKTVVELLPLFDLDEWTSDQIAALFFALCRIYVDQVSDAGLNYAIEKAFQEILAKQYIHEEPERASVVLTKFTKLFPHVDNAIGALFVVVQRIFFRVPPLRAYRIKALAEIVAYLTERQPKKSLEHRFQIDEDRKNVREWKLPNEFFEIYSSIPHIYEHLAKEPNQLYMFVQIMNIAVSKRALEPIGTEGLQYMKRQQTWAHLILNKTVYDHLIIKHSNTAADAVEDVFTSKKNDLTYLVNRKDDADELPDLSDDDD